MEPVRAYRWYSEDGNSVDAELMEQAMHAAGNSTSLVVHMSRDISCSDGILLNLMAALQCIWYPRRNEARLSGNIPRVFVIMDEHGNTSSMTSNQRHGVQEVLVGQATIEALCETSALSPTWW